jgi:hypothetical protein
MPLTASWHAGDRGPPAGDTPARCTGADMRMRRPVMRRPSTHASPAGSPRVPGPLPRACPVHPRLSGPLPSCTRQALPRLRRRCLCFSSRCRPVSDAMGELRDLDIASLSALRHPNMCSTRSLQPAARGFVRCDSAAPKVRQHVVFVAVCGQDPVGIDKEHVTPSGGAADSGEDPALASVHGGRRSLASHH